MKMIMAKTETVRGPLSPETVLHSFEESREEAAHAWSRTCTLYAHYFAALAKAETPAAIMQANADFFSRSMEVMGKSAAAFQHIGDSSVKARH